MALRSGEAEHYEITELVAAVQKVIGKTKGTFIPFKGENNFLVDSAITEYKKQLQAKYSYKEDSKIEITGKECMKIYKVLDHEYISRIHNRNIDKDIAVPFYVLEYEKDLNQKREIETKSQSFPFNG